MLTMLPNYKSLETCEGVILCVASIPSFEAIPSLVETHGEVESPYEEGSLSCKSWLLNTFFPTFLKHVPITKLFIRSKYVNLLFLRGERFLGI